MRLKLLQITVSGAILFMLLAKIPPQELVQTWQEVHWGYYLLALSAMMAAICISTLKWKLLLPIMSFTYLLTQNLLTIIYSIVLAGQLSGEAIKVYRVSKGEAQKPIIFASILADKATGLLILFATTLLTLPLTAQYASGLFVPVALIAAVGAVLVLVSMFAPLQLIFFLKKGVRSTALRGRIARYSEIISSTAQIYRGYGTFSSLSQTIFWSVVFQLLGTLCFFFTIKAFHLQLPFFEALWIFTLVSVLLFLPLSVGGLGLREGALVFLLGTRGIQPEQAVAVSLAFFSLSVLMGLLGVLFELFYAQTRKLPIE